MNREKNVSVVTYGAEQRGIVTLAKIPKALKDEPLDLTPEQHQVLTQFREIGPIIPGRHVDWNWYLIDPGYRLEALRTPHLYMLVSIW